MINRRVVGRYTGAKDGYIRVQLDDGRIVGEHRYIAANAIGRDLESNEHVHHIDHDRSNNDPSNLKVLLASEHTRLHNSEKPAAMVDAECAHCRKAFVRANRQMTTKRRDGQREFFCSRSCATKEQHRRGGRLR